VPSALWRVVLFLVVWFLVEKSPAVGFLLSVGFLVARLVLALAAAEGSLEASAECARAERAWIAAHGLATLLASGSLVPPRGVEPDDYVAAQGARIDVG
jgi:hypothetical protein